MPVVFMHPITEHRHAVSTEPKTLNDTYIRQPFDGILANVKTFVVL